MTLLNIPTISNYKLQQCQACPLTMTTHKHILFSSADPDRNETGPKFPFYDRISNWMPRLKTRTKWLLKVSTKFHNIDLMRYLFAEIVIDGRFKSL